MSLQPNVQVDIAYKAETTFGVPPTATGAKLLRRVSSNININKDTFASQEVRSDQQVADMRHGGISVRGSIDGELSTESYDDLFEALLRGTWAAGASVSPADFATGLTIATSGGNTTFTFAGSGDLLAKGFRVGDVIRASGLTAAANNDKNLRVVAVTDKVLTVAGSHAAQSQQASGWSVAAVGKKLVMGTEKRSFTLETRMPDAGVYEQMNGMRVGGGTIGVQPNGMTSVSFEFLGKSGSVGTSGYFTSPAAQGATGVLSGIDGVMRVGGADLAVVTGLQINISNNLSAPPALSTTVPEIFYGRSVVTGSVSAFLENETLLAAFHDETEIEISALLQGAAADPKPFLAFNMPRVKLTGGTKTVGPDGGVVVQYPFQALLKEGASDYDQSTLVIQRSNT